MDIVINILGILKYIGIGITALIAFFVALSLIGGILSLLLDVVVFIIIAPFYILFHPIMFVTKPMTCFKNIFMKCPCFGEEYHYKHRTPAEIKEDEYQASVGVNEEEIAFFNRLEEERYLKELRKKGESLW